jgi:hypothetical protein
MFQILLNTCPPNVHQSSQSCNEDGGGQNQTVGPLGKVVGGYCPYPTTSSGFLIIFEPLDVVVGPSRQSGGV